MEDYTVKDEFIAYRAKAGDTILIYIADKEVLGRREEDSSRGIVLKVPEFMGEGSPISRSDAIREMLRNSIIILYGGKVIELAVELGLVDPQSILDVNGLKHVQIFKFTY